MTSSRAVAHKNWMVRCSPRVPIDIFHLFPHDHSTKIYGPLSFMLSLCTTIRPKIRVLIDLFFLFVYDQSTKVMGHSYSAIYSFLNCAYISFAIFITDCPYISYSISCSSAFIFRPLYS